MRAGVALALLAAALGTCAAAEARLAIEPQSYDFGRVRQRRLFRQSFRLSNFGSSELKLESVQADCDCLRVEGPERRVLAPGESTKLVVVFGSRSYSGHVERKLLLRSNDQRRPTLQVSIEATVTASK